MGRVDMAHLFLIQVCNTAYIYNVTAFMCTYCAIRVQHMIQLVKESKMDDLWQLAMDGYDDIFIEHEVCLYASFVTPSRQ